MRVVFDTQLWVRGLLATKPNSVGATLLRAARDKLFECVGSKELLEELAETLSARNIARRLTRERAIEALAEVAALLEPLVELSGETMGCEDPEDDHILELAVKGKAHIIATNDQRILCLQPDARKRLDDGRVTVFRDDVFCKLVSEFAPAYRPEPSSAPAIFAIIVEPTSAWRALADQERLAWLKDRQAQTNELMMGSNGIFAVNRLVAPDQILLFWNLLDRASVEAVIRLLSADDVLRYFDVKWHGWALVAQTQTDVWGPFLSDSFPADPTPPERT